MPTRLFWWQVTYRGLGRAMLRGLLGFIPLFGLYWTGVLTRTFLRVVEQVPFGTPLDQQVPGDRTSTALYLVFLAQLICVYGIQLTALWLAVRGHRISLRGWIRWVVGAVCLAGIAIGLALTGLLREADFYHSWLGHRGSGQCSAEGFEMMMAALAYTFLFLVIGFLVKLTAHIRRSKRTSPIATAVGPE